MRGYTSIENPGVPITSAADWWGWGPTAAGVQVNEQRAYGLPAYYRAVMITSNTLASLPIKVYRKGTRELVTSTTVLDRPNPRQTPIEFWTTMYANRLTWGNAYALKIRDGAYNVREVWPVHPRRVHVREEVASPKNPSGLVFCVTTTNGAQIEFTDADIMHLPYFSVDNVSGLSPLTLFRQALGIAIAGDESAASLFANGSQLAGIITTEQKLDDETATRISNRWQEMNSGAQRAGKTAVLGSGAKFDPVSLPPADAQLLESRKWSVSEIARMVGVPPHLIGEVDKSTSWGTGIEEQVLGWVKFTLQAQIIATEQRITGELLPGGFTSGSWFAKFSLEGLLRGDATTRAALYKSGILDGWLTRNEVRELEDREPLDGLDEPIIPSNMAIIAVDGHVTPVAPTPAPTPPTPGE